MERDVESQDSRQEISVQLVSNSRRNLPFRSCSLRSRGHGLESCDLDVRLARLLRSVGWSCAMGDG